MTTNYDRDHPLSIAGDFLNVPDPTKRLTPAEFALRTSTVEELIGLIDLLIGYVLDQGPDPRRKG